MQDQQLTPEQQEKIKMILQNYRIELEKILSEHRIKVREVLDDLDNKKMQDLLNAIQNKN
ncbi:periplasmic heavy metal sensor [Patescibacteria group bacterium]|nr:periplasmic heavy metal sensor [Patescibacteria group bacterium]